MSLERAIIAERQGASEDQKFIAKLPQSNRTLFFTNGIIKTKKYIVFFDVIAYNLINKLKKMISLINSDTSKQKSIIIAAAIFTAASLAGIVTLCILNNKGTITATQFYTRMAVTAGGGIVSIRIGILALQKLCAARAQADAAAARAQADAVVHIVAAATHAAAVRAKIYVANTEIDAAKNAASAACDAAKTRVAEAAAAAALAAHKATTATTNVDPKAAIKSAADAIVCVAGAYLDAAIVGSSAAEARTAAEARAAAEVAADIAELADPADAINVAAAANIEAEAAEAAAARAKAAAEACETEAAIRATETIDADDDDAHAAAAHAAAAHAAAAHAAAAHAAASRATIVAKAKNPELC